MATTICISFVLLVTLSVFRVVHSQDKYTPQELEILTKFRQLVGKAVTQDYMRENKYLIRFLRARQLNLKEAERMLLESLKWRKSLDIDNILKRDFSYYEKHYPLLYAVDKSGRSAASSAIGLINPRKLLLNGKHDELRDYFTYLFEIGVHRLHRISNETGKEFNAAYLVADMSGYNVRQHGCLPCIRGWIEIAQGYELRYPQLGHKIIAVNTPRLFERIFQILRPLISNHTTNAIVLFGYDRADWERYLFSLFDRDQLLPEFGGTGKLPKGKKLTEFI